jgi:Ca2+-binding RTX toxin-like protein
VENLTLTGKSAINATGNTLDNTITGNTGANIIDGRAGNDSLNGGAGNDVYIISTPSDHTVAEIQDTSGTADVIRFISTTDNDTLTIFAGDTGIEQVVISNAAGVTTGTNALNIDASLAANKLTIVGNAGSNRITSSLFADTMIGGLGNDTYVINNINDLITEAATAGSGIDIVQASVSYNLVANVENLTLTGASAINATGNASANTLTGNDAANILNGMAGADHMIGGLGNDTYIVDNVNDLITENADEGIDVVQASVNFSLASIANVENLTLTGKSAINATGNTLDNTISGNTGANIINGSDGNDILFGGLGNDTLTGGAGTDHFVFNTALNAKSNKDSITDFLSGTDKIYLENAVMTALGLTTGSLTTDQFFSSSTAVKGNDLTDRIIYNTTTGALYYDADGSGKGNAVQFATLVGVATLTVDDFTII